ncbi:MAG: transporter substrate-binding protein [Ramlibacter sp.]|uniref:Bug family tripartite tricarboxylate transporter substrate binding protein n=1 Tax=Ramlibacter sp. TaxID=1917967 RepID=UPI0026182119|nr:tripartite tricarboxylate transporter substrate binding protein [Ramlibacter sp.]MDB5751440.1 transporter substrate-binding protein [Ramlibacter sp.]
MKSKLSPSLTRRHALSAFAAGLAGALAPAALAQGSAAPWRPSKPVRFIVGFSAGGSADVLARLLAEPMSKYLGHAVVVENIVGAGAGIAMAALTRAAPDGHTIAMGAPGTHAINPAILGAKLPYKVQDTAAITQLVTQPNVLIVNKDLGINNLAQLVAWVKANPNASYGSAGVGTSNHLCGEWLSDRLGLKLTHVAYKGAAQVITDLLGGHIPMTFDNITTAANLSKEGKVKAIAVTTAKRSSLLPELPPLAEIVPGYDLASWQGLFAPRGLPAPVLDELYKATAQALNAPEVRQRLAGFGSEPVGQPPSQFAAFLSAETKRWGDIVRAADLVEK